MEGVIDVIVEGIRNDIFGGPLGKAAALVGYGGLRRFRRRMNYDPYASAPLLGVAGVSVVTHGRARAAMLRHAIDVAERAVATRLIDAIVEGVASAA
jgi:glycerol-3-phosphate acyltransferase PlsX